MKLKILQEKCLRNYFFSSKIYGIYKITNIYAIAINFDVISSSNYIFTIIFKQYLFSKKIIKIMSFYYIINKN